jgi:hypothetical protein
MCYLLHTRRSPSAHTRAPARTHTHTHTHMHARARTHTRAPTPDTRVSFSTHSSLLGDPTRCPFHILLHPPRPVPHSILGVTVRRRAVNPLITMSNSCQATAAGVLEGPSVVLGHTMWPNIADGLGLRGHCAHAPGDSIPPVTPLAPGRTETYRREDQLKEAPNVSLSRCLCNGDKTIRQNWTQGDT